MSVLFGIGELFLESIRMYFLIVWLRNVLSHHHSKQLFRFS